MKIDTILSIIVALLIGLAIGTVFKSIVAIKSDVHAIAVKLDAIETEGDQ